MIQNDNLDGLTMLMNEIKQVARSGGNITHILHVIVSKHTSEDEGNRIRQAIFTAIGNIPIHKKMRGQEVDITWRTTSTTTCVHYHCDSRVYGDVAVHLHTKMLLKDLLVQLDGQFNNAFSNGTICLDFLVTKPLSRQEILLSEDIDVETIKKKIKN